MDAQVRYAEAVLRALSVTHTDPEILLMWFFHTKIVFKGIHHFSVLNSHHNSF